MTKAERAANANRFIEVVSNCGREFFFHKNHASSFMVDMRGKVWFVDAHSGKKIYTHWERGQWRGFSEGGTLRSLVIALRDYIRTGNSPRLHLGPWPLHYCGGDLWGYGDDMMKVRAAAAECFPPEAGDHVETS